MTLKILPASIKKEAAVLTAVFLVGLILISSRESLAQTASSTLNNASSTATSTLSADAQRAALEAQLTDLENQINQNQKMINQYQGQGKTLQNQINTLNAQINKANLQIRAINLTIDELNQNINDTQVQINQTENDINDHKLAIAQLLQSLYESDQQSLVAILLANDNLSDFFDSVNNITLAQTNLRQAMNEIVQLKQNLLNQQQQLAQEKTDNENMKSIQVAQQQNLRTTQNQKAVILKETKGKESAYQKILAQNQDTAAQIRSRIFQLLGGGQLTFAQAYNYAKLASSATGVPTELILAILDRESALGQNVGKCSYKTAMSPTRDIPLFLNILSQLGLDPNSQTVYVSCANRDGAYGGAMGPAQFIPSTWNLYAAEISKVTGNAPANPWNNADAFVATALYMQNLLNSGSCKSYASANQNVLPYQMLLERCAAAKYYAGSNWYTYRLWYGQPVVDQANKFAQDIAVLNSNGNS